MNNSLIQLTQVAKSVGVFFLLPLDDICNIGDVEVFGKSPQSCQNRVAFLVF